MGALVSEPVCILRAHFWIMQTVKNFLYFILLNDLWSNYISRKALDQKPLTSYICHLETVHRVSEWMFTLTQVKPKTNHLNHVHILKKKKDFDCTHSAGDRTAACLPSPGAPSCLLLSLWGILAGSGSHHSAGVINHAEADQGTLFFRQIQCHHHIHSQRMFGFPNRKSSSHLQSPAIISIVCAAFCG